MVMHQMIVKVKMSNSFQVLMKKMKVYFWKMLEWL